MEELNEITINTPAGLNISVKSADSLAELEESINRLLDRLHIKTEDRAPMGFSAGSTLYTEIHPECFD